MNEPNQRMRLNQGTGEESRLEQSTHSDTTVLEFETAEELLRHDAANTPVPAIAVNVPINNHGIGSLPI